MVTGGWAAQAAAQRKVRELGPRLVRDDKEIVRYKGVTARSALLGSMTVGVLLAGLLGLRILYPLLDAYSVPDGRLGVLFNGLDIVITAAVIGGGPQGIHPIINVVLRLAEATWK